jgi:hypothetical protein
MLFVFEECEHVCDRMHISRINKEQSFFCTTRIREREYVGQEQQLSRSVEHRMIHLKV